MIRNLGTILKVGPYFIQRNHRYVQLRLKLIQKANINKDDSWVLSDSVSELHDVVRYKSSTPLFFVFINKHYIYTFPNS